MIPYTPKKGRGPRVLGMFQINRGFFFFFGWVVQIFGVLGIVGFGGLGSRCFWFKVSDALKGGEFGISTPQP